MVKLPEDGVTLIFSKQDLLSDTREYVGFGIEPDIEVKPTIMNIIQSIDPVLDAALKDILQEH